MVIINILEVTIMKGALLYTAAQLNEAILKQWHVVRYQHDELLDQGGAIEYQTKDIVKMKDGQYFMKSTCEFLVQSKVGNLFRRLFWCI
ncbi:hypothetical protein [Paenibacillus polysaccharolyticus]|uniref:hypothetical protein n=1 Tax=Paenibacillus polysaccharolyticus TaxID=582692 RepID=UPI00280AD5D6|nr:hypothetical protein [Paenibacillus polysaccharolyticus]